jgi:hypothetical protein
MLTKEMSPVNTSQVDLFPYKSVVGKLIYISITARPDIAPAVSTVGRFSQNPGIEHWKAVIRILCYLKGTVDYVLTLGGCVENVELHAYADADWGGDVDRRRSRTGFTIFQGESLLMWCSKLQKTTALSSMEAEYMAVSSTSQDVLWLRTLLMELGFKQNGPTTIYEDNKACIDVCSSYRQHPGAKHIDIRYHFIRDKVIETKEIQLKKLSTGEMVADMFTKALAFPLFSKHRHALGLNTTSDVVKFKIRGVSK